MVSQMIYEKLHYLPHKLWYVWCGNNEIIIISAVHSSNSGPFSFKLSHLPK